MSPELAARTVNAAWAAHVALQNPPARLIWRAGDDNGVAHAHSGKMTRTYCNRRVIGERFAWPRKARCEACITALEGATL